MNAGSSKSLKIEPHVPAMAAMQPAAAASMKNVHAKCDLSQEMQSSKKNESSHPNNSISVQRIEEYKGIQISMAQIEESEQVNEESE